MLSISNVLGLLVGVLELVVGVVLVAANSWFRAQVTKACKDQEQCEDELEAYLNNFLDWSRYAGFALFGLFGGQLLRLCAGRVFRKSRTINEFEDPFTSDYDVYSAAKSFRDLERRAPEKRWGR